MIKNKTLFIHQEFLLRLKKIHPIENHTIEHLLLIERQSIHFFLV